MSVHVAAANTLHAEDDAPDITEARPGSLRTSSFAVPCDLGAEKVDVVRDGIRIGQGVLAGIAMVGPRRFWGKAAAYG